MGFVNASALARVAGLLDLSTSPRWTSSDSESAGTDAGEGVAGAMVSTEGTPAGWVGMRTVAALRREQGVGPPRERDSLYRPIERPPRRFNPLKVPKSLQVRSSIPALL